jgi:hypothetical protein
MREEEIRARMEATKKNLALARYASERGTDSDNHGSEDGVPPEVALDELRESAREANIESRRPNNGKGSNRRRTQLATEMGTRLASWR